MNDKMEMKSFIECRCWETDFNGFKFIHTGKSSGSWKIWKIRFVDKSRSQTLELSENYDELNVFRKQNIEHIEKGRRKNEKVWLFT